MSQSVWNTIVPSTTSGNELAALLNDFKNAVMSGLIGASRPTETTAGGAWVDNSLESTLNVWDFKIFTGTSDITVFRLNLNTGTASIGTSSDLFEILRVSVDNVGPILQLQKERVANNGQFLSGDVLGEVQFVGAADDLSKPVVGRIKVVASDNGTATTSGGYMVFEATADGTAALTEMMRLVDGKLGIGTTTPENTLHVKGSGIRAEYQADNDVGPNIYFRKKRIASLGKVLANDDIGKISFNTTDETGAEITDPAFIIGYALEDHTTTAQGTELALWNTLVGATAPSKAISIGDEILLDRDTVAGGMTVDVLTVIQNTVGTATEILALPSTFGVVRFTGSTATALKGIVAGGLGKFILLYNASSADITLIHNSLDASAADRLSLPGNKDMVLASGQAFELFYDETDALWRMKSGSAIVSANFDESIANNGQFSAPTNFSNTYLIDSTGGAVTANTQVFGSGTFENGIEITLIGNSDTNSVAILHNDASKGCLLNGDCILKRGSTLMLKYNSTLDRFIELSRNQIGV